LQAQRALRRCLPQFSFGENALISTLGADDCTIRYASMKKYFTKLHAACFLIAGLIIYLAISSYSTGITGQSVAGCSCHGSNTSSTVLSISGIPTGGWVPGTAYTITISVTNTSKSAAGFDLTVSTGTLSSAPSGTSISGSTEIRHTTPKSMSSGTASWSFTWTAPSTSTSSLTINFAGNAVDGNFQDTNDQPNQTSQTFTPALPPTATTNAATGVGTSGATLNGSVNAKNNSTTVSFEYGTTTSYGSTATATPGTVTGNAATAVSGTLSGLASNTLYHFRVKAVNSIGTTYGSDATFTTLAPGSPPTISVQSPTNITNTGAKLNALVNANGASTTVTCVWGATVSYGNTATVAPSTVTGTTGTSVSATLTGLTKNKLYHYKFSASNSAGTNAGVDSTFTTTALSVANIAAGSFAVFPNPVRDVLMVEAGKTGSAVQLSITDAGGRRMDVRIWRDGDYYDIATTALPKGLYVLRILQDDQVQCRTFLKE
jgi:hypothetical protein